ncbi:MAG: hypothetical protein V4664_00890 [Patescibacteria group bacterium]
MHFELASEEQEKIETLTQSSESIRNPVISVSELEHLSEGNPYLEELLETMLKSCLEYTITVANFKKTMSENKNKGEITEELSDVNTLRRSVHNKTIDDINIFSRTLAKHQKDNSWMQGGGMDGKNRSAYGKFALTLTLSRI